VDSHHLPEGTHSLAPRPGSLVRLTFQTGAAGRTCTLNLPVLSGTPLLIGLTRRNWCIRQDSHLQTLRSKRRMIIISLRMRKWGRRRDSHSRGAHARQFTKLLLSLLSHIGEMACVHSSSRGKVRPMEDILCSDPTGRWLRAKDGGLPRIRTAFSPVKSRDFTVKVCNSKKTRREGGVEPPRPGR
jgi:hypothetical protein